MKIEVIHDDGATILMIKMLKMKRAENVWLLAK